MITAQMRIANNCPGVSFLIMVIGRSTMFDALFESGNILTSMLLSLHDGLKKLFLFSLANVGTKEMN